MFGLIDKSKQMENLVDRFCAKYQNNENKFKARNITFCLTLITYNEKALRRLSENFKYYRHELTEDVVLNMFKEIITNAGKAAMGKQESVKVSSGNVTNNKTSGPFTILFVHI